MIENFLSKLLFGAFLMGFSTAIGQSNVVRSSNKNSQASPDFSRTSSQNDPLFNSLGDTCLQIGYPCDTYGSVCVSQKSIFPQARKAESSGRCKCRPGFFEVETSCNRPPIFLKLPYKFHVLSLSANQTVGIIRAKDPDNNEIDLQLTTSEFTLNVLTGELQTTQQYLSPKTVTFSAIVTDNYGSESIVPVTVAITVPEIRTKSSSTPKPLPTTPETTDGPLCSLSEFCDTFPDASAFLLGPFQLYQTYLLFFGPYVLEYLVDWNTTVPKIQMQTEPDLIASYFNLTLDDPANVSVLLSYSSLAAAGDGFLLNLILNVSGEICQLRCTTDPAVSSHAVIGCQLLEKDSGQFTVPGRTATSQLFIGDNQIYHYVVSDSSEQSLLLMDGNFNSTLQKNNFFLTGQARIENITAIQLIQDQVGGSDGRFPDGLLAVFGVGRDGHGQFTTYLGFGAHNPFNGNPNVTLTAPLKGSFSWIEEPQPLRKFLAGC